MAPPAVIERASEPAPQSSAAALASALISPRVTSARHFAIDPMPGEAARLAVVCGGCEHCPPDYAVEREGFELYTLEFVAQGTGSVELRGAASPLTPGTLFAYGPGIPHRIVTDPATPLVKYFVCVVGHEARALLEEVGPQPGEVIFTSSPADVLALWEDLIRAGLRKTSFASRIAHLVLEQLMLRIGETSVPRGFSEGPAFATYLRCRHHIETHWRDLSTLDQLARECHVAPAYVCRLFRRFDRQSPYQYLLRQKMTHAATRLLQPGATIREVASELGFTDPFHFSRAFRRAMSIPPGQFVRMSEQASA